MTFNKRQQNFPKLATVRLKNINQEEISDNPEHFRVSNLVGKKKKSQETSMNKCLDGGSSWTES